MGICSKDFYWEAVSGTCQPCDELCHQADVRGTGARCRKLCPVSLPEPVTALLNAPTATTSATLLSDDTSSSERYGYGAAEYAVVILAVSILLISLVSSAVLFRREIYLIFHRLKVKYCQRCKPSSNLRRQV